MTKGPFTVPSDGVPVCSDCGRKFVPCKGGFDHVCRHSDAEKHQQSTALRDQFAMAALPEAMRTTSEMTEEQAQILAAEYKYSGFLTGLAALIAYELADAMLEARKPK